MWRLAPFYIAVAAAPLLFGGVKAESQALLGLLLALGLIFTHRERTSAPTIPRWLKFTLAALLLIQLLPLPIAIVRALSPERARLATDFPIDGVVPTWITLSTSPARTAQRLWELTLAAAAFILARHNASQPGGKRRLAITIATALLLLCLADLWSSQHGRTSILGLWSVSWGKGYGTFANHNHFANWIFVGALFCIGWVLRELSRRDQPRSYIAAAVISSATMFAIMMAFLSASRSGALAFAVGLATFAFLSARLIRRSSANIILAITLLGIVVTGLLAAEPLLKRFQSNSTGSTLSLKTEIRRETIHIASNFPLFGSGLGSFVRVFNHYETAHGDGTFLHAENDYLEFALEVGVPCAALLLVAIVFSVRGIRIESLLTCGTIAGLTAFATHSLVEFAAYVPANLILAATLAGSLAPTCDIKKTASAGKLALAFVFLALSCLQFAAWYHYWHADRGTAATPVADLEQSLRLWPFATDRNVALLRAAAEHHATTNLNSQIKKALWLDPLNLNLRVEQAWFELAYSTNTARTLSNAWLAVKLQPRNGQVPLRFARHFRERNPDQALQFLGAADASVPANHREALTLAWEISHEPAQLWRLTPNNTNALLTLVHVAVDKQAFAVALQACDALNGRIDSSLLAALRIESLHHLGRYSEAIVATEKLCATPQFKVTLEKKFNPTTSFTELSANQSAHPNDPIAASMLAEKIASLEPHDIGRVEQLAKTFPTEPRIAYLAFQLQTNLAKKSELAASLANQLVPH